MEFYLFILIVLFGTALADLVVGVSNDAVNFLNSAVGSKAASRRTIMIIASLGVLFGTTFSSGMMEIARKGIFNPQFFVMHEVMIIFLAVMLTDILLLDLYNTFGLPTSTTVSLVFEILGGSVAIALVKAIGSGAGAGGVFSYINTANVIAIISGIGLSIVFAFVFGVSIQFITRLIFTFNYEKTFKRYGAIYCSLALTTISYFILMKGAKGSSLLTPQNIQWLVDHLTQILIASFLGWLIIWQLIISFTKINALKIIVLIGTFALALAFAANDLVNFIGAPMGALSTFKIGLANKGVSPFELPMAELLNPVRVNSLILLIAGMVMVLTLWRSKKARTVTKTEVSLGRQEEGVERFESSVLARSIVRMAIALSEIVQKITPKFIQAKVRERIDPNRFRSEQVSDKEKPAFDLLRAAVNLMVSSALISFGTSLKLPLSTTFVTFMVAMSTSLADKSWGRESAVYRVNGVLTVIGGWFFTAFMAFSACFIFALFIYYVKLPAILALLAFGLFFLYRSTRVHKRREAEFQRREREHTLISEEIDLPTQIALSLAKFINTVSDTVGQCLEGLIRNHRKQLKLTRNRARQIITDADEIISDILHYLKTSDEKVGTNRYARMIGALEIIVANVSSLTDSNFNHINNNHKPPDKAQSEELEQVGKLFKSILKKCAHVFFTQSGAESENINKLRRQIMDLVHKLDRNQVKRIRVGKSGTRQSLLFVSTLTRTERIAEQVVLLVKLFKSSQVKPHLPVD